jgi:LmbE family N-acetylglucosaminyl deacetylase
VITLNQPKNKFKILFFTPHADDIELGTPFMFLEALRLGNEVVEVVMTNNEFGTLDYEFKGNRLRKIREKELDNANRVFGKHSNNKVRVVRMGYIDGYLLFNSKSVNRVVELIRKEKPKIIFAPDPWYAQDFHKDHLNTGRLIYFSLKILKEVERPKKVFYYYSFRTRFYFKCRWKDFKIVKEAQSKHKSQYTPLEIKLMLTFYNKFSIFRHFFERGSFSESFREQKFKSGFPEPPKQFKRMSFRKRVIYYIFSKLTIQGYLRFHNLTAKELGLE